MKEDLSHRRHAIQVVASLPEDSEDALIVLRLAKQLVTDFLDQPAQKPATVVTLIGGGDCA